MTDRIEIPLSRDLLSVPVSKTDAAWIFTQGGGDELRKRIAALEAKHALLDDEITEDLDRRVSALEREADRPDAPQPAQVAKPYTGTTPRDLARHIGEMIKQDAKPEVFISGGIPPDQPAQTITATAKPDADEAAVAFGIKPFFYAVADNEGKPVMDEICCCESPEELADYFQDRIDDLTAKVVPVYTAPQIETMRDQIAALRAKLEEANYWRHNYADAVKVTAKERDKALAELAEAKADAERARSLAGFADTRRERDAARAELAAAKLYEGQLALDLSAARAERNDARRELAAERERATRALRDSVSYSRKLYAARALVGRLAEALRECGESMGDFAHMGENWSSLTRPLDQLVGRSRANRERIDALLSECAANPERSGPTAEPASKPDVAGSADAKLLSADVLPEK